jgi:hypothetical protein
MKNLYFLDGEEKDRILNLHESATKRQYLSEQGVNLNDPLGMTTPIKDTIVQGPEGDPYQYMKWSDKFWYAKKNTGKNPNWTEVKTPKGVEAIKTKIYGASPKTTVDVPKKNKVSKVVPTVKNTEQSKKEKIKKISKYNYTPRIDQELKYIVDRDMDNKPFFIYDPKENLIYLFAPSTGWFSPPTLVDYTSVVDGADVQKDAQPFTIEDWCKVSKKDGKFLLSEPYKCTDPTTGKPSEPIYSSLTKIAARFLPKGIYSISSLSSDKGYVGKGKNVLHLKDSGGKNIVGAIHGIPAGLPDRLTASADLESLLKKQISSGKVPQEYLDSAKSIAYANQSFGCVGVPAKFIDNPNVKKLAQNARLFVMGETKGSFLVQNSTEFFDKLHGDGQQCVDPIMLAQSIGENNTGVA